MMTVAQPPLLVRPHNNRQLFSDHYLDAVLPTRPEWGVLAAEAAPIMARIAALFAAFSPSDNEAQTEQELVRPVLAALGHTFEVQPALRTPDGTKKPDYVLYRDRAAVDAAKNVVLDDTVAERGAIAVADAKYWDRPLDVALKGKGGDPFTNKNPSYQISFYLLYSGLTWGILTNGRRWRLYHAATAHKFDRFYEVDLKALAEGGDVERFLYFYAPFRRAALDAAGPGPTLASILAASEEYAHTVGEGLKGQVYDAVRLVAQGFLDHAPNGLDAATADLRVVYDSALIVLYRLLFVFYAEARALLPVEESPAYRDSYSLRRIARDVAGKLERGEHLLTGTTTVWARLRDLFGIIDAGSPPLKVATFNGGLFDPRRHPFLERHAVGDARLLDAIDKLARVGGRFVDYRDLAERHLGTIYEGLLEFHPEPLAPGDPEWGAGWTMRLVTDKGERRASGSYYTPDWVVQYIIDQAVGPALRAAVADQPTDEARIAAVLALNVLDPAMGSGHFPVAATEYIARFLVDQGLLPPGGTGGEADLAYWKRRVAQNCIYGVDLNPLAVELAKLSLWLVTAAKDKPLSFLDHHLRAGNALVGANLADVQAAAPVPTAAQMRKARQAQRVAEVAAAAGQASWLADDAFRRALGGAVGAMATIEGTVGDTIAEVKEQERLYAALRADLNRRYERLANLATAARFGVAVDPALWGPLADYATGRSAIPLPRIAAWLDAAEAQATGHRFFHWELEFPEVFFGLDGGTLGERAGFDAVIGNPPYVRQEHLTPFKAHFADAFRAVADGAADIYVYFFQQGLQLARPGGRLSFIVANKWLRSGFGKGLRGYLGTVAAVEQLVDFGHAPIFPDADAFPCITVLGKLPTAHPQPASLTRVCQFPRELLGKVQLSAYVRDHGYDVPADRFGVAPWSLGSAETDVLLSKIRGAGVPLGEFLRAKSYLGLKTGLNAAFVVDTSTRDRLVREDARSAEVLHPFLRGRDLERWLPAGQGLWLIMLKSSGDAAWPWATAGERAEDIFQRTYPAIYGHLKPLEAGLRKRGDRGRHWWELRSCAYYDAFERPKILYPDIAWRSQFAIDRRGHICNNSGYFLPTDSAWVLAVLNSPLMWWYAWREATHGKDEALRFLGEFVEAIPIAPSPAEAKAVVETTVERLTTLSGDERTLTTGFLDWLRLEFDVAKPGERLEAFATLDEATFLEEVRQRRPRKSGRLTPASLGALRGTWVAETARIRAGHDEANLLERRLADLVNEAYGLTTADITTLWRTAPPRMPITITTTPTTLAPG